MLLGIDHLVIACADPDVAVAEVTVALGLEPGGGGRHERYGTFNRLVFLGDAYLELMGVFDRELAAARGIGAATLAILDDGREGLASFAVASDDIAGDVVRLRQLGASYDDPAPGERRRPDGEVVRWRTALPAATGTAGLPFLIEHEHTGSEWGADVRRARREGMQPFGGRASLARIELPSAEPAVAAERHGRSLDLAVTDLGGESFEVAIGPTAMRFVRGAAGDPATIVVAGTTGVARTAELLGCRFRLEIGGGEGS